MDIEGLREKFYNARLVEKREPCPGLGIFRVKLEAGKVSFKPGQFTTLGLLDMEPCVPGGELEGISPETTKLRKRAYSISHPICDSRTGELISHEVDFAEFYVVLITKKEKGKDETAPILTPRLFKLEPGSGLFVGKVTGHYSLRPQEIAEKRHFIFCSTGTGEAPHNAMIWRLLCDGYQGSITSVVCVRKLSDLAYQPTYETLCQKFKNVTYIGLATREPNVKKQYIQDILESGELEERLGEKLSPGRHAFYLCGNPALIGAPKRDPKTGENTYPPGRPGLVELLAKRGFSADAPRQVEGQVHFEKYW